MALNIKTAKRELVFSKIALMGASGSGKTYSALRMAKGMSKALEPILGRKARTIMLNNEASRGLYYADEFEYDIADIAAPHNPEKYVEAINECVKAGYDILILDSSSHEWEGDGGCLSIQQGLGGRYTDWGKVTPRHNKFIQAVADSPIHIIATMRGKDQYEVDKTDNNKTTVTKIGVGAKQREGFEYEFTATLLIEQQDNFAKAQKDNTHLFENKGRFLIKEEDGEAIVAWANSGEAKHTPVIRNEVPVAPQKSTMDTIIGLCTELGGQRDEELMALVKKYAPKGNPKVIKKADEQNALLDELEAMKVARGEGK